VVDNSGWAGCSLIRPRPWKVIRLKDKLIRARGITDQTGPPVLHPLPVPGWLWTRGPDRKSYAVDYAASTCIPIADEWEWAVSPDGKWIAEVDDERKVTVRDLRLPAARPAEPK
jgi:hypothetical protein